MASNNVQITAVIPNGTALSNTIDLQGLNLTGFQFPAAWTTANVTIQSSPSLADGSCANVWASVRLVGGTEATVTVLASQSNFVGAAPLVPGARYIQIRSGTAALPVNQGADRTIYLFCQVEP